jgi:UDP-glucose 4-epimerase
VTRLPRPGELQRIALDSGAAHRVLGWRARTGLAAGLGRTVAWLREQLMVPAV